MEKMLYRGQETIQNFAQHEKLNLKIEQNGENFEQKARNYTKLSGRKVDLQF